MKIFLDPPLPSTDTFTVQDDFWEYYLTTVKRLRNGETVHVAAGDTVAETTVDSTDPLRLTVRNTRTAETPDYSLHLVQAITRKQKFEETIKQGTELGVTEFTPIVSEQTVRVPNNEEKQLRRWKKIAMDSARITGRDWMPEIKPITSFDDLSIEADESAFYGDVQGEPPGEVFEAPGTSAMIVVGPEGGFTDDERTELYNRSARPVSLGDVNYRAETASLTLAVLWLNAAAAGRDRAENPNQNP